MHNTMHIEMTDANIREIEAAEHGPILGSLREFPGRFAPVGSDDFADYCNLVRRLDLARDPS